MLQNTIIIIDFYKLYNWNTQSQLQIIMGHDGALGINLTHPVWHSFHGNLLKLVYLISRIPLFS